MTWQEKWSQVYDYYRSRDWFASDDDNISVAQSFRTLCEISSLLDGAYLDVPSTDVVTWVQCARLQIDELQWKTFVILNSTVGDMVRLLGQSLSIVSDSVGSERTEFISLNLAPFPSAKELISRGIMTEEWIGYLVQLRAEYRRISTSVAQLQFEFSIARAILHEGFVLVVELAKASRMIGYSIALVELNGKSTGP